MDARLAAIRELRSTSTLFANGTLPFGELVEALRWYSFDDEDDEGVWDPRMAVKDLQDELQAEYLFYVKWRGSVAKGLPKSEHWTYGECNEPWGWIDKPAFQRVFADEFRRLKLSAIPGE